MVSAFLGCFVFRLALGCVLPFILCALCFGPMVLAAELPVTSVSSSVSEEEKKACSQLTGAVMDALVASDVDGAIRKLVDNAWLPRDEFQTFVRKIFRNRDLVLDSLGRSYGWEFLSQRSKGSSLQQFIILEKLKTGGLAWVVDFYKSPESGVWKISGLKMDDPSTIWPSGPSPLQTGD